MKKVLLVCAISLSTLTSYAEDDFPNAKPITSIEGVKIEANGHEFSPIVGFPTTAFNGAAFKIILPLSAGNIIAAKSSDSGVTINTNGDVKIVNVPNQKIVHLLLTSSTQGSIFYTVQIKKWFNKIKDITASSPWKEANNFCQTLGNGFALADFAELSNAGIDDSNFNKRDIGTLWSEWGNLTKGFGWSGESEYWTKNKVLTTHNIVRLSDGAIFNADGDTQQSYPACVKNLQ